MELPPQFLLLSHSCHKLYQVIKTKDTSGISLGMYIAFVLGVFLWIIHGIKIQDMNLIGANAITFVFASIILTYKIKYK